MDTHDPTNRVRRLFAPDSTTEVIDKDDDSCVDTKAPMQLSLLRANP